MSTKITPPSVKGWCPGALRPMVSGDGLVVRIRPHLARISGADLAALCALADTHGNGLVELTQRANLQLRGVTEASLPALHEALGTLGLLDPSADLETRRNILTQPLSQPGDATEQISAALAQRLSELPELPAKFGFAVDLGAGPMLGGCSADIRFERGASGELLIRADGAATGRAVTPDTAVDQALALAHWFAAAREAHTRMAKLLAEVALPAEWRGTNPAAAMAPPPPGQLGPHLIAALPFGRIHARDLAPLAAAADSLRVTPFRALILDAPLTEHAAQAGLIIDPSDPLLRVTACPGAPHCASASVETFALARRLAPQTRRGLHVSGCSKGCAHAKPAPLTLVGRNGRFDIVTDGTAQATPTRTGCAPSALTPDLLNELT